MPTISFKRQRGSVRLVRHCYSPIAKRGVAVTVGSVMLDADPDEVPNCIRLRAAACLTDDDIARVREWLQMHGCPEAAKRRREKEERLHARFREHLAQSTALPPLEEAVRALELASGAISEMAADARAKGFDPWDSLRPRYMAVYRAWNEFQKVAQAGGVARTSKRAKRPR